MDVLKQNFPTDNEFHIEHDPLTNTFSIKEDFNQSENNKLVAGIETANYKLKKNLPYKKKGK